MTKKILIGLGAFLFVVAGIAAMSAYEAHIINVTAHIENALSVPTDPIVFGTVFPQEDVDETFTMTLSQSFQDEYNSEDPEAAYGLQYVINQKPKCICTDYEEPEPLCQKGEYAPVNYWNDECPDGFDPMPSLCPFLSKLPVPDNEQDTQDRGVPSYYKGEDCYWGADVFEGEAQGRLNMNVGDVSDTWTIDLKVPPVEGYVSQDWPEDCPTVPENDIDYGCDLWIEVERIVRGTPE